MPLFARLRVGRPSTRNERGAPAVQPGTASAPATTIVKPQKLGGKDARDRSPSARVACPRPRLISADTGSGGVNAVKAHLTNVFQRIGVTDRMRAALWAQRHGIADGAPR